MLIMCNRWAEILVYNISSYSLIHAYVYINDARLSVILYLLISSLARTSQVAGQVFGWT